MKFKRTIKNIISALTIKNLVIFAMPISLAILILMLYNFSQTVEHLSHSLIKRTINETNTELHDFFDPVVNNLLVSRDRGMGEMYENLDAAELNPYFIPFLKNSSQVSSMLIATSNGEEYMLLQEDSTWQNRCTKQQKDTMIVSRMRWKYNENLKGIKIEEWIKEGDENNNPLLKTWYLEAIENSDYNSPAWTNPYTFKTTKDPGITTSIKWKLNDSSATKVIAFDILLTDISKFTSNLEISKTGKAIVFTEDGNILGLPPDARFTDIDSLKKYVLQHYDQINIPVVEFALKEWKSKHLENIEPFYFKYEGDLWWCGVEKFALNSQKSFYIAVMVPEGDFLAEVNRTRIVIISGFLLVSVLTLLVIRGYNQKRKANELLKKQKQQIEAQKNEIEEIHHELTSSIGYAQRIQNAVLPNKEFIDTYLPSHFVLYKPHSVVSGDFYWATKVGTKLIFTAADCTGHGVPGAFMSMLGISFLNDIVRKSEITTAGEVLDSLRENVIHALKQKVVSLGNEISSGMKDGMDISLCVLDISTYKLQFAGANNPLYIVRKINGIEFGQEATESSKNYKLYEIKADKMPIAIYEKMDNFTTHEIQLQKDDKLYMFSDGFVDQFGGPKGKKFKSKPFKILLLEIAEKSMTEQKQLLEKTFEDWKKHPNENGEVYTQIDDVVVLGVMV